MISIAQALQLAKQTLTPVVDNAPLESALLLAFVLGKDRSYLYARPEYLLRQEQYQTFLSYVEQRAQHKPLAYITGSQEFWSLPLQVSEHTLIPRADTEVLIEYILAHFPNVEMKVADLGTGSGAIALALAHERPAWHIYATDLSENALAVSAKNAQQLALSNISFHQGNWFTALDCQDLDLIVSNPPYIAESEWPEYAQGLQFEPKSALTAGWDGLDDIRQIVSQASHYLRDQGCLIIEHGFNQGHAVANLFKENGFHDVKVIRDLGTRDRATLGIFKHL